MVNSVDEEVVDDQLLLKGWRHLPNKFSRKFSFFSITTLSIDSDHLNCALYQTAMVHKELRFTLKSESAFMEILLENQFKV